MNRPALPVTLATFGLCALTVPTAHAVETTAIALDPTLTLNPAAYAQPEPAASEPAVTATKPASDAEASSERSTAYGQSGSRWWTITLSGASNFDDINTASISGAWSQFIADDFEFAIEASLWYLNQDKNDNGDGVDTGGVSGSFLLRWHFVHGDDYSWSVFADAGIGLLGTFSNFPEGGTGFNFIPRLGMGATFDLDSEDGADHGARLMVGLRWQHISNGRIEGDNDNPAFDGLCAYAALVIPF